MNELRAAHINTELNIANYEAARTGFFSLMVPGLNSILKGGRDPIGAGKADHLKENAEESLRLNVLTSDVPHFSLEVLQYKRGNETVKFAGVPTFEAGTVKVDDVVGLDTKNILMAWQGLAYNTSTGKGGYMKDYKRTCTLIEYDQNFVQVRKWKLEGCWISALSEDAFDKENDGKRAITATIQYDRARVIADRDN